MPRHFAFGTQKKLIVPTSPAAADALAKVAAAFVLSQLCKKILDYKKMSFRAILFQENVFSGNYPDLPAYYFCKRILFQPRRTEKPYEQDKPKFLYNVSEFFNHKDQCYVSRHVKQLLPPGV